MNSARIELKLVLDQAGFDKLGLATFSERFNLQKRIYLIQLMGQDLGYRYSWYLRGPYSRDLTADAFTLKDELAGGERDHERFNLSDDALARIEKAKRLWAVQAGVGVDSDQWLELLASLHYLRHIAYWPKGSSKDFESVFKAMVESKPKFAGAKAAAQHGWKRLEEFGLIAAKTVG